MSFLDIDERLLAVAQKADLVYSPLVDAKIFPEEVDITLVEGSVSSEEDLAQDPSGTGANQDSRIAGRLRDYGECSGHAQFLSG